MRKDDTIDSETSSQKIVAPSAVTACGTSSGAKTSSAGTSGMQAAVQETFEYVLSTLTDSRGIHAETAIHSVSLLAGCFLLLSCDLPLDSLSSGTPVFADAVNTHGPLLLQTFVDALEVNKIVVPPEAYSAPIPPSHRPNRSAGELLTLLLQGIRGIQERRGISLREMSSCCAVVAALLVRDTVSVLDPAIGAALALNGLVEGSKRVP